jgi:pyruvate/2-oxoglutarate dehydrogenase complex dihydrolipoamide acyltransferase (E2) component
MSKFTNAQVQEIAQVVAAVIASGQFSTPAPVVEAVKPARKTAARKTTAKKTTTRKSAPAKAAPAKAEAPAEVKAMFEGLAATREPMKPLNKALAAVLREQGRPWVKATEADEVTLKAAFERLSKTEAKAARKALASRKAAKSA